MERQYAEKDDKLCARFTSWLTTLLQRVRIDYVRHQERQVKTVPIDDVSADWLAVEDEHPVLQSQFEFEKERLAEAFFSLSPQRQKVLTMLFVDEMKPEEIAKVLQCSVNYVYKVKQRALQSLRKILDRREDAL